MDKFRGKYRIASARWAAWDYGRNAAYFVTICTQGRAHDFGQITGGELIMSPVGQAVRDCWLQIPGHFPFVRLGAFVVMPNHIHGITVIDKPDASADSVGPRDPVVSRDPVGSRDPVETQNIASLQTVRIPPKPPNRYGPQSQNLAAIVRGHKIGVTKFARQNGIQFGWQARYHDRVIRDADEYARIERYIQTNPENWESDSLFG